MNNIKVHTISQDYEKIKIVKKWLQTSRIVQKNKLLSPILVPRTFRLTPELIADYASAINTLLPEERVTDYTNNQFLTVKKEIFAKVCHNKNFEDDAYYMALDEFGWHIV